jgi:hypothetical protein
MMFLGLGGSLLGAGFSSHRRERLLLPPGCWVTRIPAGSTRCSDSPFIRKFIDQSMVARAFNANPGNIRNFKQLKKDKSKGEGFNLIWNGVGVGAREIHINSARLFSSRR